MGTYADSLLSSGETVIRRERQHWLALLLDARAAIALWLVAVLILVILVISRITGSGKDILSYVALGALVIGIVIFIFRWWQWRSEEYMVTSRRLLKVSGIINKESGDSSLEKINDAVLFENLLGRLLNYGDLDILTAAEVAVDRYRMLNHAKAFKIDMLNAKHSLEHEVAYVEMPSPPIRASTPAATPVPMPAASAAMDSVIMASTATPVAAAAAPAAAAIIDQAPPIVTEPPPPTEAMPSPSLEAAAATTPPDTAPSMDDGAPAMDDGAPAMEAEAAPESAASGETATAELDTPDEVMEELTRLSDLRDKGAITAEEYEAKKQELLGRL